MSALLLLFSVSFANVFVLAFQSRNINSGQYALAAIGSVGIGMSQAFVWKAVVTTGWLEALVYSVGGGLGCICAMYTHRKMMARKEAKHG